MSQKPITFVLFGATGDLAQKKIMPALLALFSEKKLGKGSKIIAFSRRDWDSEDYRDFIRPSLTDSRETGTFLDAVSYVQGTFSDPDSYTAIQAAVSEVNDAAETKVQVVFFLAVKPSEYAVIAKGLGTAELSGNGELLMIEKPFGTDAASARELEESIRMNFTPEQIVHVDHYLAKPGIAALLEQRRNDPVFEERISATHIKEIHVHMHEAIDIQGRGEFYDATGTFKDVVQNHALEILATLLAELPASNNGLSAARERAITLLDTSRTHVIAKGQYEGYRALEKVDDDSETETYIKVRTESTDPRWQGIPMLLEAGKSLPEKRASIRIVYRDGTSEEIPIDGGTDSRDAYEVLIESTIEGSLWLFPSFDEIIESWNWSAPLLQDIEDTSLTMYGQNTFPEE